MSHLVSTFFYVQFMYCAHAEENCDTLIIFPAWCNLIFVYHQAMKFVELNVFR